MFYTSAYYVKMNYKYAIIFFISLVSISYSAEKVPLRICKIDSDFNPFTNLKGTGIWQKKLKKAVQDLPVDLKFHEAPRKRCLFEAKQNLVTDAIVVGVTEKTKTYLSFPMKSADEIDRDAVLGVVHLIVVVRKDSKVKWDGKKFKNLGKGIIGIQHGFQVEERLDSMGVKKEEIPTVEKNFEKIAMGRIAGAIVIKEQFALFKNKNRFSNIIELPIPFQKSDMYLGVSTPFYQKNKKIVEAVWANLKKVIGKSIYRF